MSRMMWYVRRLRAMSVKEMWWRLLQARLQRKEERMFGSSPVAVSKKCFYKELPELSFNLDALGINFGCTDYTLRTDIHLLGGYSYGQYKDKWHAGFQTANNWPLAFSYKLGYKQRDDIGDARTNWELNRHFQFVLLAKAYYATGDGAYRDELQRLWTGWNEKNPFLHGISWTSVMEAAIRSISWMYALAFLQKRDGAGGELSRGMTAGILNMTAYVAQHRSRYSSANNHLIVEAAAIGLAGYAFGNGRWKALAMEILSDELVKQTYDDGVNKELSLHYQMFVMEAYALMAHAVKCGGDDIPAVWLRYLEKMAEFVAHSTWRERAVCEFGDDDEGKILDLAGGKTEYFNYVLQLCSLVTGKRYHSFRETSETAGWLFPKEEIERMKTFPLYDNSRSRFFVAGGNSFLRDAGNRILIGIDHAALGFGTIAAHGHADALSFQVMADGKTIFADPGTYIYHCNLPARNRYRRTINHNTLCVGGADQSEMTGAFLWGRKAHCRLLSYVSTAMTDTLVAEHDGYSPNIHTRTFEWDKERRILNITDRLSLPAKWSATLLLGAECTAAGEGGSYMICRQDKPVCSLSVATPVDSSSAEPAKLSAAYGTETLATAIRLRGHGALLEYTLKFL